MIMQIPQDRYSRIRPVPARQGGDVTLRPPRLCRPRAQYNPIKTIKTSVMGTMYMLGLAKRVRARILLASAGEVKRHTHRQAQGLAGGGGKSRRCLEEEAFAERENMRGLRDQG